jgi:DNA polymerase-3 subunit alpha
VPFAQIETMPPDSVFRCAFIVETVQVRLSSKSQKKFAILMISDGMERYELPIWPELFEEKGHLLRDNQLLYAVLQLEKKEGELKLNCRWLDDLSQADEAMVAACDMAYDKAKYQAKQRTQYVKNDKAADKSGDKPKEKQENPVVSNPAKKNAEPIKIQVDADKVSLSHILKMKQLFEKHRGAQPLQIDFLGTGRHIASLHIGAAWGIESTPQFEAELREFRRSVWTEGC